MKTRLPFLLLSTALFALLAAGCGGGGGTSSVPNDAIATVGSTSVPKASFDSLMQVGFARYKASGQPVPKVGTPAYTSLRDSAVNFLVQQQELGQEAQKLHVTVTQKDIDKQVDQIQKTYYKGSKTKLLAALKKDEITLAQVEQYELRPNLLGQKLENKVTENIKISDAAALHYFKVNKTAFKTPETREVRHILVKSKSLAQRLEQQIKNGASFAQLAKKYSTDKGSAVQGGKICVAHGGQSGPCQQTVTPFDKAAFSLKTNEVSLVHSTYGWHVIQPIGAIHPTHHQSFKEVESQIKTNLASQRKSAAWQAWLAKLANDFKGKVSYQAGYAPATVTTPTPTAPAPTTTG